jgi:hypothetical protein
MESSSTTLLVRLVKLLILLLPLRLKSGGVFLPRIKPPLLQL